MNRKRPKNEAFLDVFLLLYHTEKPFIVKAALAIATEINFAENTTLQRLPAVAGKFQAIARSLQAIAGRLQAMAGKSQAIAGKS